MDYDRLNLFVKELGILIENNKKLETENQKLNNIITQHNDKILKFDELQTINETNNNEVIKLTNENLLLKKELALKSSKSIWETSIEKIKEKDDEIEQLKKMIEFYKRQQNINSNVQTLVQKDNNKSTQKQDVKHDIKQSKKTKLIVKTNNSNEQPEVDKVKNKKIIMEETKTTNINDLDEELERELMG